MPSVKHNSFTFSYLINRVTLRMCKKYITVPKGESGQTELLKKDVLLITHEYDKNCLFVTAPIIFDTKRNYVEFKSIILETLRHKIEEHSMYEPERVKELIDCTNRYAWGKLFIYVNKIKNFPYQGSILVRLSVQPQSLSTKRIMDSNNFVFQQGFYMPVASHFFTLKIEVINLESVGFFRENFKEHVLDSYDIRIPDLHKDPFQKDGSLVLPIKPITDYKKVGLKLAEDASGDADKKGGNND